MNDLKVVFMGTPEFAVGILDRLLDDGLNVSCAITAPDKPAGRGRKLNQSAVKEFALKKNIPVLQPEKLKSPEFIKELKSYEADLFVVVAFRMLPEIVWSMPKLGTINLHASLLPQYRGAAPINWAIMNGEKETGVTTFFIEKEIDTGAIIDQRKTIIDKNETVGQLYNRLIEIGAELTSTTVNSISQGNVHPKIQSSFDLTDLRSAPKIFKQDCEIDFNVTAVEAHNFCRGLDPYPGAWCKLYDTEKGTSKTYKLFSSRISEKPSINSHLSYEEGSLLFPFRDKHLIIKEIQPEGKRKMSAQAFALGNTVDVLSVTSE